MAEIGREKARSSEVNIQNRLSIAVFIEAFEKKSREPGPHSPRAEAAEVRFQGARKFLPSAAAPAFRKEPGRITDFVKVCYTEQIAVGCDR